MIALGGERGRVGGGRSSSFSYVQNTLESACIMPSPLPSSPSPIIACLDWCSNQTCIFLMLLPPNTALMGACTNVNQTPSLPGQKLFSDFPSLWMLMPQILPTASELGVIWPCPLSAGDHASCFLCSSHSDFHQSSIWLPQDLAPAVLLA